MSAVISGLSRRKPADAVIGRRRRVSYFAFAAPAVLPNVSFAPSTWIVCPPSTITFPAAFASGCVPVADSAR